MRRISAARLIGWATEIPVATRARWTGITGLYSLVVFEPGRISTLDFVLDRWILALG